VPSRDTPMRKKLAGGHAENCCFEQKKHEPHEMVNGITTRWPFVSVDLAPTSTTSPIFSWPRMSPARMPGM
jgi:hypothetical protein